jgi:outer membrane lipoprotein-sorting protein
MTLKRPGMIRQEFTVQGMQGIMAGDGENYWMHMPFMGRTDPEPMPNDQIKQMVRQADIEGPLMNAEEKGITLELVGKEDLEGTEVFHITVTREDGDVEHHFLDAEYYVPLQVKTKTEMQGQEMEMTMVMGDYKEVGGLMVAHSMQIVGGTGGTLTMSSVEIDPEIDDSIFAMPEPAPATEDGTDG